MIQFQNMEITDFGSFATQTIQFKPGVWLVTGANSDSQSSSSNGSGKSTMFQALGWGLFGRVPNQGKYSIVRSGQQKACVQIVLDIDGAACTIKRTKSTTEHVRIQYGTKNLGIRKLGDANRWIVDHIGLTWDTYINTVYYAQNARHIHFGSVYATDTQRKDTLDKLLGTEVLNLWYKAAITHARSAASELSMLRMTSGKHADEYENAKAQWNSLNSQVMAWEHENDEQLAAMEQRLESDYVALKKLDAEHHQANPISASDVRHEIEIKLTDIEEYVSKNNEYYQIMEDLNGLSNATQQHIEKRTYALNAAASNIQRYADGRCPMCGTKVSDSKPMQQAITDSKKDVGQFSAEIKAAKLRLNSIIQESDHVRDVIGASGQQIGVIRTQIGTMKTQAMNIENAAQEHEKQRFSIAEGIAALKSRIESAGNIENPYLYALDQVASRVTKMAKDKTAYAKQIKHVSKQLALDNSLADILSKDGPIHTSITSQALTMLNRSASKYLGILTDNDIRVHFDATTELKTGQTVNKVAMHLSIDGQVDVAPSGGQAKRIAIAVDMALMEILRHRAHDQHSMLVMDEIFDGLDEIGMMRAIELLHSVMGAHNLSIYVITHVDRIASSFAQRIHVTKKQGVSHVE